MNLANFPWYLLLAVSLTALTFLILWSISEVSQDRQADLILELAAALEDAEDDLATSRLTEHIAVNEADLLRLELEQTRNRITPATVIDMTTHPAGKASRR